MEIARQVLVLLHLIGFASLFGGFLVQLRNRTPEVNAAMLHGAFTMLLTGVLLVGRAEMVGERPDYLKIGIKLGVTVLITFLVAINRKYTSIPRGLWAMIGMFTLANAVIAVLWA
jgi:hypothetical protein